jgi:MFS family permease
MLLALFLLGWGLSMVWGPISDRIGRVRALVLTILCYSVFTFFCGLVTNIWQLAVLRVFVGLGIGGEQPVGAAYLAEELSESQRKIGAGLMHTGYYFGFFFASVANYFIGANYGWRWMFVFGGFPALLVGFIQFGVRESTKWQERFGDKTRPAMRDAFVSIFSPSYVRRTIVSGVVHPIIGLWGDRSAIARTQLAVGWRGAGGRRASLVRGCSHWNVIDCVAAPFMPAIGRRARWHLFRSHGGQHPLRLGAFYLPASAISLFWCIFLLGRWQLRAVWLPGCAD